MTEQQWLTAADANDLLNLVWRQARLRLLEPFALPMRECRRKLRLLACACCRLEWAAIRDDAPSRLAVETAEAFADGRASIIQLNAAREGAVREWLARFAAAGQSQLRDAVSQAAAWIINSRARRRLGLPSGGEPYTPGDALGKDAWKRARAEQAGLFCDLIRDLFGNPYRPAARPSGDLLAWNGGTVRALAEAVAEGAFGQAPILADALEDAGCAEAAILSHLRGPGPHVRGCWALDLILGSNRASSCGAAADEPQ
jgi:hypothetical protein